MSIKADNSILLIDELGRHQKAAPAGFDWKKFPEEIVLASNNPEHAGWHQRYWYIGTIDGTLHYSALATLPKQE